MLFTCLRLAIRRGRRPGFDAQFVDQRITEIVDEGRTRQAAPAIPFAY